MLRVHVPDPIAKVSAAIIVNCLQKKFGLQVSLAAVTEVATHVFHKPVFHPAPPSS